MFLERDDLVATVMTAVAEGNGLTSERVPERNSKSWAKRRGEGVGGWVSGRTCTFMSIWINLWSDGGGSGRSGK